MGIGEHVMDASVEDRGERSLAQAMPHADGENEDRDHADGDGEWRRGYR